MKHLTIPPPALILMSVSCEVCECERDVRTHSQGQYKPHVSQLNTIQHFLLKMYLPKRQVFARRVAMCVLVPLIYAPFKMQIEGGAQVGL